MHFYNIPYRTSTIVRKIDFPAPYLKGLVFGGPRRDTLFVIVAPKYVNPFALNNEPNMTNTKAALYAVTELGGVAGFPNSRFPID